MEDYYAILDVPHTATAATIKKAYRKIALKIHPDKDSTPGATAAFQQLGRAWAELEDVSKRASYDVQWRATFMAQPITSSPSSNYPEPPIPNFEPSPSSRYRYTYRGIKEESGPLYAPSSIFMQSPTEKTSYMQSKGCYTENLSPQYESLTQSNPATFSPPRYNHSFPSSSPPGSPVDVFWHKTDMFDGPKSNHKFYTDSIKWTYEDFSAQLEVLCTSGGTTEGRVRNLCFITGKWKRDARQNYSQRLNSWKLRKANMGYHMNDLKQAIKELVGNLEKVQVQILARGSEAVESFNMRYPHENVNFETVDQWLEEDPTYQKLQTLRHDYTSTIAQHRNDISTTQEKFRKDESEHEVEEEKIMVEVAKIAVMILEVVGDCMALYEPYLRPVIWNHRCIELAAPFWSLLAEERDNIYYREFCWTKNAIKLEYRRWVQNQLEESFVDFHFAEA